ncbi:MAG: DUF3280 domain-containing protein [Xanthobacteraceae bacterium]
MLAFLKIAIAVSFGMLLARAHAVEAKVAVFDKLVDTSLEGATFGPRDDQDARLAALRDQLANSGLLTVVDIELVAAQARVADPRNCDDCDGQFASQVAADFAVTGWVQKVSNLILNMNIMVSDAKTGCVISVKSDMRGNTDESRSRAIDWLIRFDLLGARGQGVFQ